MKNWICYAIGCDNESTWFFTQQPIEVEADAFPIWVCDEHKDGMARKAQELGRYVTEPEYVG